MKKSRIELIIKLIGENDIENQEELVKLLANNGVHITQATASRDIARLNIVKIKKDGKSCYALYDNSKLIPEDSINLLKGFINKFNVAQNQIFIKTESNKSKDVERIINSLQFDELIGTISNDSSLLLITKNNEDAIVLSNKLYKIINQKKV